MAHRHSRTLQRLAWERLWRILLAPPTEVEQARLQSLRDEVRHHEQPDVGDDHGN
jgi:hypothetical protein